MNDLPTGPIKVLRTRMRANKIANAAWRTGIFIVGFLLVIVGIVLLVLPGPGWLLIFIGFLTLATEFAWASRVLAPIRVRLEKAKVIGKKPQHFSKFFCSSIFFDTLLKKRKKKYTLIIKLLMT